MSTEPRQVVYTPVDVADAEYYEPDAQKTEEEIDFNSFRDEMRDSDTYAKITVARQPTDTKGRPIGKKLFQCFECGIDDYTFSQLCTRIREDYGTGIYRIQGRDAAGKFKFNKSIGIEAPKTDNALVPAGNSPGDLIDRFSDAMERQQARFDETLRGFQNPMGGDPLDQMTKIMGAMGAMMGAMGIQNTPPKTMIEQLTEFKMLKELMGDLGGGDQETGEGNIYGLLTATVQNLGPLLGAALSAGQKSGDVNESGIIQSQIEPPKRELNEMTSEQEKLLTMKPQLEFLLKQAKGGAEPFDVAQFILKAIPDDQLENVEEFLTQEKCIEKCAGIMPEINDYLQWFGDWRSAMLNGLAQVLDVPDDTDDSDISVMTETPEMPEMPEMPETPETPETSETSDLTDAKDPEQNAPDAPVGGGSQSETLATTGSNPDNGNP